MGFRCIDVLEPTVQLLFEVQAYFRENKASIKYTTALIKNLLVVHTAIDFFCNGRETFKSTHQALPSHGPIRRDQTVAYLMCLHLEISVRLHETERMAPPIQLSLLRLCRAPSGETRAAMMPET